jgi:DNA mismatch repair protein MutS2
VELIQDNNRAAELRQEEKAEEFRILENLTGMVRDLAGDLEYAQFVIGRLDGLFARARFSEAQSCIMPEIGFEYGVELRAAKNPILLAMSLESSYRQREGEDFPVPVDILLDGVHNILIISGPNRGGKTVTLKTLGLMSLMAQAGIHIPAEEGSYLPIFDQVMADIGDDQDIQAGLSTFSAHAAHLTHILEQAHKKSLVIIDEPGMGTDPDEGVALSMAVLDVLSERGTFAAVSTHSNRLKAYGLSNKRAKNASVEFNDRTGCPTFKLSYGIPGISHALEVAREIGLPSDILDRAREYLDRDEVQLNRLIEKMNYLRLLAEQEKKAAEDLKEKYFAGVGEMEAQLVSLEAEKRALIQAKRLEADTVIKEAKEELKQAVNLLKKKKETVQALVTGRHNEAGRKLTDYFEKETRNKDEKSYIDPKGLEKGQIIYHKGLKKTGVIQSVDLTSPRVLVMLGNIKVSARIQDVELIKGAQYPDSEGPIGSVSWHINSAVTRELNVVGYRIDDAIPLIDKTIDRALVDGELTLRIIHGFGTGRLRDAIRGHLKEVPYIKNVCSADSRSGGNAITIVEL